ncbi:uncharacterized protein PV06_07152 [Exophiala oligosperma]|uniref:Srp40 C-terminal domain-containing protein n=1 Tax=Exophiala oligosperma TaxID=215243 RepID=A0A0D2ANU7_9EURO|nr:uncharacterized protein PV06_07152 [Exophiala oligosperma]KIW41611.1 hypothetical protein PV06_07152 [Exophiala oligosperma]
MAVKKKEAAKSDSGPSAEILGLVGHYLTSFGLESTHKAFQKEVKTLQKRSGWPAPTDAATVSDLVPAFELGLLSMVQDAMKSNASSSNDTDEDSDSSDSDDSTSSSDDSGNDSDGEDDLSSSDSDSGDDSDDSSSDESSASDKLPQKASQKKKILKRSASTSSSSSSSSSTSESSIDREEEVTVKPTATKNLKRKVEVLSSSDSSSDSGSDSDSSSDDDHPVKRAKVVPTTKATEKSSRELSSGSDSDSSEDEAADDRTHGAKLTPEPDENSDSSNTVMGDNMAADSKPDSTKPPKKHVGARPTPLAQLSAQATVDSHISNAYQSYDYADRAYKDLSVTRGKGFTKEKNKKKRGSYRGGAIDISGGKAFKFDD